MRIKSLFASQEARVSHSMEPQHCALPRGLTLLPFPLWYQKARWEQTNVGTCAVEVKMAQGEVLDQRGFVGK